MQDFINQNNGKQVDLDGFPAYQPFQCYDLANKWSLANGYGRFGGLNASDIFGQQPQNYTWVRNSPTGVPPAGAVVVWDGGINNGPGHVAIATGGGDTNTFVSLDQNWNQPRVGLVRHDYNHVIGWGIPKNNVTAGGGDMIPNGENEFNRWNDLHHRLRGRYSDRATFQNVAVGKTWLSQIELLSDDPEANGWFQDAVVGQVAVRDKWDQQIYGLQDQLKKASDLATQLQAQLSKNDADTKALNKKVEDLNKKVGELQSPDNIVVTRTGFSKLFDTISGFFKKNN
jgi:hypothetical protein